MLEPLSGYLLLGHLLYTQGSKYAEGFNLGPNAESVLTVAEVAQLAVKEYGRGSVKVHKKDDLHEANLLMLDITKAEQVLGWVPTYTAQEAVAKTIAWYKRFYQGEPMLAFTLQQIHEYEERILWKKN